jgi:F420-non-reducing hydrogenase small subunit
MSEKPKVAFYWCASCGGCEEAVVDLAEDFLTVAGLVDIVFWPVALDYKKSHVQALPEGSVAVSFINGAVRTTEQEEMALLLREKSKHIVAFGSCAHTGGVPGLANQGKTRQKIQEYLYENVSTVDNPLQTMPQDHFINRQGHHLSLPTIFNRVLTLDQSVEVDYYVPGCPPTPELVKQAVLAFVEGNLPPQHSVFGGTRALCHECDLNQSKPEKPVVERYKRIHEVLLDPTRCLLSQEVACLGPVTRSGCGALCVKGNMPCSGCFGPLDGIMDSGAKALSMLASIVTATDPEGIETALAGIPDPTGSFYRYSLPASLLGRARPRIGDRHREDEKK